METRKKAYCAELNREELHRTELYSTELNCSESESGNAGLNRGELENYVKPGFEVIGLSCEGIICTSTGSAGSVSDPEMGEEASWPGFNGGRGF